MYKDKWIKGRFQSTLPSRGATYKMYRNYYNAAISIHAPLAGSDQSRGPVYVFDPEFQSTLPSRGATA